MGNFDKRFYLVTTDGSKRYAAVMNGAYQIGKERDEVHTSLAAFARAVILQGKGGRFSSANGVSKSILAYRPTARSVTGYWLDPDVAKEAGVPSEGALQK